VVRLRTIFDTNIYIAAALRPGQHADRWLDIASLPTSGMQLFVSSQILDELHLKLTEKFGFKDTEIHRFVERIKVVAQVVEPAIRLDIISTDPKDNIIVECAVAARAHLIVSADTDLLKLGQYEGIGIAHPRELKNIFASDLRTN
jgi:uncharacterized protein